MDQGLAPFNFYIDQPDDWRHVDRHLVVRGWCFSTNEHAISAIRLQTSTLTLIGVTGIPRPDVKATVSGAPHENTGFEIRGLLPVGHSHLTIEAQLTDGSWHNLCAHTVNIRRQTLPSWLGDRTASQLIASQMPTQMTHSPHRVVAEKFTINPRTSHLKFSIVTPSYNQAKYLPETIHSVLGQTGVATEYVVQDGGSTDGSAAIIQQQAGQLHSWTSMPDGGQSEAIAGGFAKTNGEPNDIMAWINSDDFYLSGALGFVASYFAQHPKVDVLYGHRILVDENSQEIGRWFLPKHDPEVLRLNDFVPQETMFWRRRIWDKVGGIDTAFKFAMDWDLLLRFQSAGAKIVRVPYFLACFRIHATQKTSAQMHSVGQTEIDDLRTRSFGRPILPTELEANPHLLRYLRRSAFIEGLWKCGIRSS